MRTPPTNTPALYAQENRGDQAIVHAHYSIGPCHWYLTEYDPVEQVAFGWVCLADRHCAEYGYVSLDEMGRLPFYLRPEFDDEWVPVTVADAIAGYDRQYQPETATTDA